MTTITRVGMPLDEFIELSNAQPFELIHGERIPKLPTVYGHTEVAQALFLALHLYAAPEQLGEAVIEGTFKSCLANRLHQIGCSTAYAQPYMPHY